MFFSPVPRPTVTKVILVIESISSTGGLDTSREEHAGLLDHRDFYEFDSAASIALNIALALFTVS